MINAEIRSVYFATQNPLSSSKVYFQKWLLEQRTMDKQIEKDGYCKSVRVQRFSLIPLWYSSEVLAGEKGLENTILFF